MRIDWKRSWYKIPLVLLRAFFLLTSWFILKPLAEFFEIIGDWLPGLERK